MRPMTRGRGWVALCGAVSLTAASLCGATTKPDDLETLRARREELCQAGNFAEAAAIGQRALELAEKPPAAKNAVAESAHELAKIYRAQGLAEKGEPLARRAVALFEEANGPESARVADALDNLVEVLYAQRRFADAEPLARRAVAVREGRGRTTDEALASSLNSLAGVCEGLRRFDDAEPL